MVELRELPNLAFILITLTVLLGIGSTIVIEIGENSGNAFNVTTTINRTITLANNTEVDIGFHVVNSTFIITGTDNAAERLQAGDLYFLTPPDFAEGVTHSVTQQRNSTDYNLTYDAHIYNLQFSIARNSSQGLVEIASWLPLIGLVIAASVIIALIVGLFVGFKRGD